MQLDAIRAELEAAELCHADPRANPGSDAKSETDADMTCPLKAISPNPVPGSSDATTRRWQVAQSGSTTIPNYVQENLVAYVGLRKTQIDGLCGLFFDELSQIKNQTRYGRDLFNIASEFATVALGVSGSPAEQLALLSGVQLSVNDAIDASEQAMLLSPDPHKVFLLVNQTQKAVTFPRITTFAQADTYVREYARPCTFLGIQAVIDTALSQEIARNAPGGRVEEVNAATDEVLKIVNRGQATPVPTLAGQALPLYWLFVIAPADGSEEQKHTVSLLPTSTQQAIETALADPTRRAEIQTVMLALDTSAPSIGQAARAAREGFAGDQRRTREQAEQAVREREKTENDRRAAEQRTLEAEAERRLVEARTREGQEQDARDRAAAEAKAVKACEDYAAAVAEASRTGATAPAPVSECSVTPED